MISVSDIKVTFGKGTPLQKQALNGVSLTIEEGQFVTVIGSNGAGKSTLLGVLAGDVIATEGQVKIGTADVTRGVRMLGEGGLPIGLVEGAGYQRITLRLRPGDRLLLASDGVTECPSPDGAELGAEGLNRILAGHAGLPSPDLLEAMIWEIARHAGTEDFPDDISALILDYRGS